METQRECSWATNYETHNTYTLKTGRVIIIMFCTIQCYARAMSVYKHANSIRVSSIFECRFGRVQCCMATVYQNFQRRKRSECVNLFDKSWPYWGQNKRSKLRLKYSLGILRWTETYYIYVIYLQFFPSSIKSLFFPFI